jgi:hypothetical protein
LSKSSSHRRFLIETHSHLLNLILELFAEDCKRGTRKPRCVRLSRESRAGPSDGPCFDNNARVGRS